MKVEFNTKFEIGQKVWFYITQGIYHGTVQWVNVEGMPDPSDNITTIWQPKYKVSYSPIGGTFNSDFFPENCLYASLQEAGDIR